MTGREAALTAIANELLYQTPHDSRLIWAASFVVDRDYSEQGASDAADVVSMWWMGAYDDAETRKEQKQADLHRTRAERWIRERMR